MYIGSDSIVEIEPASLKLIWCPRISLKLVWCPRIFEWDRVVGFRYSQERKALRYDDTKIEEWLAIIDRESIDSEIIRRRKIICVDSNDESVFEDTIYRFIYAEIWHEGTAHILNAGKWYAVDTHYAEKVEREYKTIQAKAYQRNLLMYDDESEKEYNERLAASNPLEFVLMDSKNILLTGAASPVEPCDLYCSDKELIHVKRYGGSGVLSHLFNQGLVSGELLQSDKEFREKFNDKLPEALKMPSADRMPNRDEYTVVYAIISGQELGLTIPFFSKISLKHAVARLEAFGFKVRLAKIEKSERKKKTKICKPV